MSEHGRRQALLDKLAACDTPTLQRLAALLTDERQPATDTATGYLGNLKAVADSDINGLVASEKSYGNSWKLRGGVDTFHMLRRKWDRIEKSVATSIPATTAPAVSPYDIFEHIAADRGADGLIDDVRDLRRYLMLVEAEMMARKAGNLADSGRDYLDQLQSIAHHDIATIEEKEASYGSSWTRSGGIGAFMMFARKWDRILQRVATRIDAAEGTPGASRDNVFEHLLADRRTEGVIDDIRGLRQYLLLVEAEMAARGAVEIGTARDNRAGA